jgi:membrane-bound serine protease (ClpP class)
MDRSKRLGALSLLFLSVAALVATATGASAQGEGTSSSPSVFDVIPVKGIIDPPTAEYLSDRLAAAERDGAEAAVIQLDTPGGLDVAMRSTVTEILESEIPVVVWVAPRGARAASAGTFITLAAHLAYMADATELGAATPISLSDGDPAGVKATEDAAAFIRSIAETRGRNVDWADRSVREGVAIGSQEAVEIDVIDGIASSLADLIAALDGTEVDLANGTTETIETFTDDGALSVTVRFQQMGLVQRLLHAVTTPDFAFLLLLLGIFGLIFELYNPGIGLAGILGGGALLLGFYGLSVLPTNWLGVLLVVAAIAFFIIDLQIAGFGIWTLAGIAAVVSGGAVLFSGASEVRVDPWTIGVAVALTLIFFMSVMTAALRVRLRRPITGEEGIVGTIGEATTDIAPEGTVLSKGMLWRARTMEMGIAAGSKVEVKATEGLTLLVEPLHEEEPVG